MTDLTYVCHSFDDGLSSHPAFASGCVHVDLSGQPLNANFNEASLAGVITRDGVPGKALFAGLAHYRRRLRIPPGAPFQGSKYVHREPQPGRLDLVWNHYHSKRFMDEFLGAWRALDASSALSFESFMKDPRSAAGYLSRNLMTLPRAGFLGWARLMTSVRAPLEEAMKATADDQIWKDRYQKRQPGFACERVTAWYLAGLPLKEVDCPFVFVDAPSPYQREAV